MSKRIEFCVMFLNEIRAGATVENDTHEVINSPEVEKQNTAPPEIQTVERIR